MEKHIKDYLLKYNQVQVSDFGIFEVVYKTSYIHPILHTFSVPGKYIVFSENKTQDDDFAFFVSKKEKITIDEAKNRIENWVQEVWKTVKEEKKQFDVSSMGSFFLNAMGRIEFAAILDTDISPQSFGLEEFKAKMPADKKVEVEETESEKIMEIGKEDLQPEKKKKKRTRLWFFLFILLACVLFVEVVYFAFPDAFAAYKNKTVELFNDIKLKITENKATTATTEAVEETLTLAESEKPTTDLEPTETLAESSQEQMPSITNCHYVIIGSFRDAANADNFLKEKQTNYGNVVNLGIGHSGYYLVGIGPYSEQEAENKRKEIPNAWIFRKK